MPSSLNKEAVLANLFKLVVTYCNGQAAHQPHVTISLPAGSVAQQSVSGLPAQLPTKK